MNCGDQSRWSQCATPGQFTALARFLPVKGPSVMRILVKLLLALGLLMIAQTRAFAYVHIDVDLSSQTMTVRAASGETHVWPIPSGKQDELPPVLTGHRL